VPTVFHRSSAFAKWLVRSSFEQTRAFLFPSDSVQRIDLLAGSSASSHAPPPDAGTPRFTTTFFLSVCLFSVFFPLTSTLGEATSWREFTPPAHNPWGPDCFSHFSFSFRDGFPALPRPTFLFCFFVFPPALSVPDGEMALPPNVRFLYALLPAPLARPPRRGASGLHL